MSLIQTAPQHEIQPPALLTLPQPKTEKKLTADTKAWLSHIKTDGSSKTLTSFGETPFLTHQQLPSFLGELKQTFEKAETDKKITSLLHSETGEATAIIADLGDGKTLLTSQTDIKTQGIDDKLMEVKLFDAHKSNSRTLAGFHFLKQEKRFAAVDSNSENGIPEFERRYKGDKNEVNDLGIQIATFCQKLRLSEKPDFNQTPSTLNNNRFNPNLINFEEIEKQVNKESNQYMQNYIEQVQK